MTTKKNNGSELERNVRAILVFIDWDAPIVRREIREDGWHVGYYDDGTIGELVHPDTYRRLEEAYALRSKSANPPQPPQTP